jgi:hypothetical protein
VKQPVSFAHEFGLPLQKGDALIAKPGIPRLKANIRC